jgi:hypothetical protein
MKNDIKLKRAAARACDDGATPDDQLVRGTDGLSEERKSGRSDHRVRPAGYSTIPNRMIDFYLALVAKRKMLYCILIFLLRINGDDIHVNV